MNILLVCIHHNDWTVEQGENIIQAKKHMEPEEIVRNKKFPGSQE
jgi:hypothetical protein